MGPTIRLRRRARKTGLFLIIPSPPHLLRHRGNRKTKSRNRKPGIPLRFPGPPLQLLRQPRFPLGKAIRRHFSRHCSSLHLRLRRPSPFRYRLSPNCHPNQPRHHNQPRPPRPGQLLHPRPSQPRLPPRNRRQWLKLLRSRNRLPRLPRLRPPNRRLPSPRHPPRKRLRQPPRRR